MQPGLPSLQLVIEDASPTVGTHKLLFMVVGKALEHFTQTSFLISEVLVLISDRELPALTVQPNLQA